MKRFLMIFPLSLTLLNGCGNDTPIAKFIVTDQKVVLTDWPDEAYVASLDSILAREPTKKKEITTNISMNAHAAPIFKLPPQVTGQKGNNPKDVGKKKAEQSAVNKTPQNKPVEKGNKAGGEAEAFANRFTNGLSKLQSDPNNGNLYRIATANDGDDIMKLLRRTYGAGVNSLPRFFIVSALKSVNPGLNLENLNDGDKVRIPKL